MSFFKPLTEASENKTIARLHTLIWSLIYGGLLTLVLGLSVRRADEDWGWVMIVVGGLLACTGAALVVVRSRMKAHP